MIATNLPLPWTLESAWILLQMSVQISFIALIVVAVIVFVGAVLSNMLS